MKNAKVVSIVTVSLFISLCLLIAFTSGCKFFRSEGALKLARAIHSAAYIRMSTLPTTVEEDRQITELHAEWINAYEKCESALDKYELSGLTEDEKLYEASLDSLRIQQSAFAILVTTLEEKYGILKE